MNKKFPTKRTLRRARYGIYIKCEFGSVITIYSSQNLMFYSCEQLTKYLQEQEELNEGIKFSTRKKGKNYKIIVIKLREH